MCFLFFKKKVKLDNPQDLMSTVVNKNIKLDTKIVIPSNFVGLIYYSDKYLFSLKQGEYKFQGDLFYKVVEKNRKRNKDNDKPTYNFNLHFVNLSRQNIELSLKYFISFKQKENINLKAVYEIEKPELFAKEILLTWYKTHNKRTLKIVTDLFKEFCYKAVKKKLSSKTDYNSQLTQLAQKYFSQYGIKICQISFNKQANNTNNFFNTMEQVNTTPEPKHEIVNTNPELFKINKNYCPNCQSEMIDGADFCHKCGYRFINKYK